MVLRGMNQEQLEILIRRYADGSASEAEIKQLMQWYHSAEINEVLWPHAEDNRERVRERILHRLQNDIARKRSAVFYMRKWRVAATILVTFGLAVLGYYIVLSGPGNYTITNGAGAVRQIHLPDSSKVWLNAGTSLTYNKAFTKNRTLRLDGEAFFDVKHNPSRPFSISTGQVTTTVVGTSFTIKAYSSDSVINIVVSSGRVRIQEQNKSLGLLSAAQALRYNNHSHTTRIEMADTTWATAWRRGQLQFRGAALSEVAKVLERWYGYSIRFADPRAGSCRYYMNFSGADPIENILLVIERLTGLKNKLNKEKKTIDLTGNACNAQP